MKDITVALKRILFTIAILGVVSTFMGCNTAHGFGKDVERTGEKIQDKTP
jgi:predicted small secreted protein